MSFQSVYGLAGQGMFVHGVRLNTVASNLAHAQVPAASAEAVYKPKEVVLAPARAASLAGGGGSVFGVKVARIVDSEQPAVVQHQPGHPVSDDQDRVFYPPVDLVSQMAGMISASRAFDTAVSLFSTGRHMQGRLLDLINVRG
ncbi:MAG: hypothetical protein OXC07_08270 [Kistimonas sp.]|nr:hypothetical protein [Kistimonas sp.]